MSAHELRTWPDFYAAVFDGRKTFEVRRNDRGFTEGDTLVLAEFSPKRGYTGQSLTRTVTYVLPGGQFGIEEGYVVMGLAPPGGGTDG